GIIDPITIRADDDVVTVPPFTVGVTSLSATIKVRHVGPGDAVGEYAPKIAANPPGTTRSVKSVRGDANVEFGSRGSRAGSHAECAGRILGKVRASWCAICASPVGCGAYMGRSYRVTIGHDSDLLGDRIQTKPAATHVN